MWRVTTESKLEGYGYIPSYDRIELTDALHNAFGFDSRSAAGNTVRIIDEKRKSASIRTVCGVEALCMPDKCQRRDYKYPLFFLQGVCRAAGQKALARPDAL